MPPRGVRRHICRGRPGHMPTKICGLQRASLPQLSRSGPSIESPTVAETEIFPWGLPRQVDLAGSAGMPNPIKVDRALRSALAL